MIEASDPEFAASPFRHLLGFPSATPCKPETPVNPFLQKLAGPIRIGPVLTRGSDLPGWDMLARPIAFLLLVRRTTVFVYRYSKVRYHGPHRNLSHQCKPRRGKRILQLL